ncbi:LAETG motif-containing sortase-dependent surface protein [Streptomyces sp. NPDC058442]|uniref:excalibur calcium-binding domain-containing protein n=1 Tax=Streptomyces sp. NPDC058442 TaxID=3346503 RepID=UPI00364788A1
MNLSCKSAAVTVAALALAALPLTTATAHEGSHPFKNCTEAYNAGYQNIQRGDEHYGKHLDRDGDGVGCDQAPAGFVPVGDKDTATDSGSDAGAGDTGADSDDKGTAEKDGGTDLAETGGNSATPYLAAGGAAVALAGGGVLFAARRRRGTN